MGSTLGTILAEAHPEDLHTLVLTGYSSDGSNGIPSAIAAAPKPARDVSARFKHLPEYCLAQSFPSERKKGFYGGKYHRTIPGLDFQSEGTTTVGEAFGLEAAVAVENFKGPVHVVTGDVDSIYCGPEAPGHCLPAKGSPVAKTATQFPNATSFEYIIVKSTGHVLNWHDNDTSTFKQVHDYLRGHFTGQS